MYADSHVSLWALRMNQPNVAPDLPAHDKSEPLQCKDNLSRCHLRYSPIRVCFGAAAWWPASRCPTVTREDRLSLLVIPPASWLLVGIVYDRLVNGEGHRQLLL